MSDHTRRDFAKLAAAGLGATAEAGEPLPADTAQRKLAYCRFPRSFLWGCATASYQVEGAFEEEAR